jgi:4-hydroxybenzoyl-CoA thioesterase
MSAISQHRIRFAHCDPAGIAYYPRLFELIDAAIEDWTGPATGISRRAMHADHKCGLPTATIDTVFHNPSRLDDCIDITVAVTAVGRTSVSLAVEGSCDQEPRFTASIRQVLIGLDTGKPVRWPAAWRETLVRAS